MALLRNIGNRIRRREDREEGHKNFIGSGNSSRILGGGVNNLSNNSLGPGLGGTSQGVGAFPVTLSSKLLGMQGEETPDLYYEDRILGSSIHGLEEVRVALSELTNATNEHKEMLIASAQTQRALGEQLGDVVAQQPTQRPDDEFDDLGIGASRRLTEDTENNVHNGDVGLFTKYLPIDAIEAQKVLGKSLMSHADSTVKLAAALSNPINDLEHSFEERYARKIIPLRKRYIDQKGQYLKYKRLAEMADNDERRSYYEALAEAAKPVWVRTSTELRTESDVMTELTAKNMAKWSRSLTLQHERALAIAAANFADAFTRAKTIAPNRHPPHGTR